jgi:ketosteroid isomerase-like protein
MSQENVDAFMQSLEAFHRGDFDSWVDSFAEDGEFIPQRAPIQGTYRGRESLREFLADNAESFEVFHPTYDYVRGIGDRVIALGKLRLRGKGSGVDIEVPSALLITYHERKAIRFEDVVDRAKALEAMGLSEQDAHAGS